MKLCFDCVFYYVSDMDRAVDFYSNVLGLALQSRDVVARYSIDGVLFELVPVQERQLGGTGNARLCLSVADIREAVATLRAKGVRVGEIVRVANGRLARLPDPDGNELVLWQND
jgi:catechol 2,3-dioxygenase-like lactoylglutathione lyase family enzyme